MKRLIGILTVLWFLFNLAAVYSKSAPQGAVYSIRTASEIQPYFSSNAVAWSPDSSKIAVGNSLGVWVYSSDFTEIAHLTSDTNEIVSISWSSDSQMIAGAGASGDGHIWIWDVTTGQILQDFVGYALTITWNPQKNILAGAGGNRFTFWDTMTGQLKQSIEIPLFQKTHGETIWGICWMAEGKALAVVADRGIYVWDIIRDDYLLSKQDIERDFEIPGIYRPASCSPDGMELATQAGIYSSQSGNFVKGFASSARLSLGLSVRWSPDGSRVAINAEEIVIIIDAVTGRIIHELEQSKSDMFGMGYYDSIGWSPDGKWLAAGDGDGNVRIWNTDNFNLETVIEAPTLSANP